MYFAIRARDIFFFSAVNPSIPTGGFFGEEKHRIYELIPRQYLPKTIYAKRGEAGIDQKVADAGIIYPVVAKPNIGERGMHVEVIEGPESLAIHVARIPGDVIIQDYVSYPLELSVMVYKFPQSDQGEVTSICRKVFLSVTGDGQKSIADLISGKPRALLQKKNLASKMDMNHIPKEGEEIVLESIGNHCRGTQFLNANAWISPKLESTILSILRQMPGVNYGRFDLRAASIEALENGKDFLIMEFNGTSSEPAHIYDPDYGIVAAYRDLWKHWKIMYYISREQKQIGVQALPWREGLRSLRKYFDYKKRSSLSAAG